MTLELSHTTVNASNAYAQSVWWADLLGYREDPDDPNLAGHAECMIFSADGSFGSPGIVMMSPHLATTKPAPAEPLTSCTVMRKSVGTPSLAASSVSEYCVFAMHTGVAPDLEDRRTADGRGWFVMADPEGNEFCILRSAAERRAAGDD